MNENSPQQRSPDFSSPIDIKAFFYNGFGACGCSELDSMIDVVVNLLEWIESDKDGSSYYDTLFGGNVGVYYLLIGIIDRNGLCEHGVSIRFPFLNDMGKKLLRALQTISIEKIDECSGLAYDGLYYGG